MASSWWVRRRMRRAAWALWRSVGGTFVISNGSLGVNPSGAQCVNVPNLLWSRVGAVQRFGNAADWVGQSGFGVKWLAMSNNLRLRAGDVVVWGADGAPPDGHVDVVLDGSRNPWLGMDQNSPLGSAVQLRSHTRDGAAGVIRVIR